MRHRTPLCSSLFYMLFTMTCIRFEAAFTMFAGQHKERLSDAAKSLLPHSTWHAVVLISWIPHLRQFEVRVLL